MRKLSSERISERQVKVAPFERVQRAVVEKYGQNLDRFQRKLVTLVFEKKIVGPV